MEISLKKFAKNSTIYAAGNIINRLGALILLPVYTNYLSAEQYGILELFYSTSTILMSVLSMGLAHAALRFYYEYDSEDKRKSVISTSLLTSFLITMSGIILLLPFNGRLSNMLFNSSSYSGMFLFVYASFILDMSMEIENSYLRAKEYAVRFVAVSIMRFFSQVILNILFVMKMHMGVTGVLTGNLIATLGAWIYLTLVTVKDNGIRFSFPIFKELFHYSYPFLLASISTVILSNADRYILKSASSLAAVGIYSLAQKFGRLPTELFALPFYTNFGPFRFSVMKRPDVGKILSKLMVLFFAGMSFLSLGIVLFTPDVLRIMSSAEFQPASGVVPVLVLVGILGGLDYFYQTGIMYSKRTSWLFYISTGSAALSIALNFLLIPHLDIYGAALARLFSVALMMTCTFAAARKIFHIRYDNVRVLKTISAALSVYVIYRLLPSLSPFPALGIKIILYFSYIPMLFLFGCFTKKEYGQIRAWTHDFVNRRKRANARNVKKPVVFTR